jgi:hypothetical protein
MATSTKRFVFTLPMVSSSPFPGVRIMQENSLEMIRISRLFTTL